MDEKLRKLSELTRTFPIVIPPGPYEDYSKSGMTYLVENKNGNEILGDNPYIVEYLLYNGKTDWLPDVSHLFYVGPMALHQSKSESSVFVFFNDRIAHLLDFSIEHNELPVFKIFLDHLAFHRKDNPKKNNSSFFPWKQETFLKYADAVTHSLSQEELNSFHRRLCLYQRKLFPGEALKNLFSP